MNGWLSNGSGNLLRRTATIAPSGAIVDYFYGTTGSLEDIFNRVSALKVFGETNNLVDYAYTGQGRSVTVTYPVPGAQLSYLHPSGQPGTGDAGDIMSGYDRFDRTARLPWCKTSDDSALADIAYGYDRANRRTWRQDLTPAAQAAFDRAYGYDTLGQVTAADRGTLNENRTAIGGIPEQAEAWHYDEQGNWLNYDQAEGGAPTITQTRRHNESNQIITIDKTENRDGVIFDAFRLPTIPRWLDWRKPLNHGSNLTY